MIHTDWNFKSFILLQPLELSLADRYHKVVSTSLSCLEAHTVFFRLSMKKKSDGFLQ